jgi:hypothetical protein
VGSDGKTRRIVPAPEETTGSAELKEDGDDVENLKPEVEGSATESPDRD